MIDSFHKYIQPKLCYLPYRIEYTLEVHFKAE